MLWSNFKIFHVEFILVDVRYGVCHEYLRYEVLRSMINYFGMEEVGYTFLVCRAVGREVQEDKSEYCSKIGGASTLEEFRRVVRRQYWHIGYPILWVDIYWRVWAQIYRKVKVFRCYQAYFSDHYTVTDIFPEL